MRSINPSAIPIPKLHRTLLGAIAPRPIAFASTIDAKGNHNLSPFSFFNIFGVNPTTLIFSPSRRGRDNTVKHTYENVKQVPEVVINMVNYAMVQQMSLASTEYPRDINEFVKAGFTPIASDTIRPFRVKESPVQFECVVRDVIETGDQGGAANLVICEIKMIHLDENILDDEGDINPHKIDLVARMGGDYYCRASGEAIFTVEKPLLNLGIGVDRLPENVRLSRILSGNDLGKLGNIETLPSPLEIKEATHLQELRQIIANSGGDEEKKESEIHQLARQLIAQGDIRKALTILMLEKF